MHVAERWWQRLFREDSEDEVQKKIPTREADVRPASLSAGRFKDANRDVSVKMLSRFPDGSENVQGSRTPKELPRASERQPSVPPAASTARPATENTDGKLSKAAAEKKKAPFHLSKVPSPVFGFRKPPDNFYQGSSENSGYLNPEKEELEKKQIREARIEKQRAGSSNLQIHSPNHSVEDRNRPALERLQEDGNNRAAKDKPDKPEAPSRVVAEEHTNSARPSFSPMEKQSLNSEDKDRNQDHPMPVRSSLPRSPHRQGASKVPFNVLMFQADRGKKIDRKADQNLNGGKHLHNPLLEKQPHGLRLPLDLLDDPPESSDDHAQWILEKKQILVETLSNFHVAADIIGYVRGPSVTRFDIHLQPGVKINKVVNLTEDIKLSLAVKQIRIAPVPGKSAVGIEIPNEVSRAVFLKEIVQSKAFMTSEAPLTAALGKDVTGSQVVTNLAKMPHGLIAGATGSGKSVCIHSLIISLIYRTAPRDLRLLLVDPKVVELAPYQRLPHLAAPVITEPKEAAMALKWAVEEMEKRYRQFAGSGVRDIDSYNRRQLEIGADENHLPYLVIIIDELADLMMVSPQDVEESVCRIAQKARAAGIHLLLATQRPSVDVITGLIKSNIPTRIAFSVSSQTDSRTILDSGGAERLLGRGDMLFAENGARSLKRLQGCFVSDEEINRVTGTFDGNEMPDYLFTPEDYRLEANEEAFSVDELFEDAAAFVVEQGQASVSSVQRHFRIGYNRAARLVDELENRQVVSGANGSKPRQVLMTKERLQASLSGDTATGKDNSRV